MLLYEVDGDMLTSKDVFRLYGEGSSSEDELKNSQPLYSSRPKTVITYVSESESSSYSDGSSVTSSGSDINLEDKGEFRKAQVNGKQPIKPLRSALKKTRTVPRRKDSLHSTEGVGSVARRSLGPRQLRFYGGGSSSGLTPDVGSPASRSVPRSASPPSILRKSRRIQVMSSRPFAESPAASSRPSTTNTHCINNIQEDLEGALQHIKEMFPSPGLLLGAHDIGVQTKGKTPCESQAMPIDTSEQPSPVRSEWYDERPTAGQVDEYTQVDEGTFRMEEDSPSSVGAVRHICDNSRIVRSFRQSQSQRPSLNSVSSITNHSLNQPQTEAAHGDVAENQDHDQSETSSNRIPDLEDPVNPNQLHFIEADEEIAQNVAVSHDINEVPRDTDQLGEVEANEQVYSPGGFMGENKVRAFRQDIFQKSIGVDDRPAPKRLVELRDDQHEVSFETEPTAKKDRSGPGKSIELNGDLHENSFVSEPTAKKDRRGPRRSIELKGDVTDLHEDSFVSEPTAKKDRPGFKIIELKSDPQEDSFETEPTSKAQVDDQETRSSDTYETSPTVSQSVRSSNFGVAFSKHTKTRNNRERRESDIVTFNPKLSIRSSQQRIKGPGPRKALSLQDKRTVREITQHDERKRENSKERNEREDRTQKNRKKSGISSPSRHAQKDVAQHEEREKRRKSQDRQSSRVDQQDKSKRLDTSQERHAQRHTSTQDWSKPWSRSKDKGEEQFSSSHADEQKLEIKTPPASPSEIQTAQESTIPIIQPPTLEDVGIYDNRDDYLMGLSDDNDANEMKQFEVRPTKKIERHSSVGTSPILGKHKANRSIENDRTSATTATTARRIAEKTNSEQEAQLDHGQKPKTVVRRAPDKKGVKKAYSKGGAIWQKSIYEVGVSMLEQERQEEIERQEKGLPKGPRRSKRQRFKPQFHERAVREYDEVTGCDRYKKDEDGKIVFESIHLRSPKKNLKRKRRNNRRKKKRRKLQAERKEIDGDDDDEDDSVNRKVDFDDVTPANQSVWAYSDENPQKEHKQRLTQDFNNVVFREIDPETGLRGGKALEISKYACGYLEILPGQQTRPEISAQTEIYILLKAPKKSLKFKMGEYVWHLSTNDVFIVPKNNHFSLENLHLKRPILLSFVIVKNSIGDSHGKKKVKERFSKERKKKKNRKTKSRGHERAGETKEISDEKSDV